MHKRVGVACVLTSLLSLGACNSDGDPAGMAGSGVMGGPTGGTGGDPFLTGGVGGIGGVGGVGGAAGMGGVGATGGVGGTGGEATGGVGGTGGMESPPPMGSPDWQSYGHDLQNTRHAGAERTITRANVATLQEKWSFPAPSVTSTPAVFDGKVYFAAWDGKLYAVDAMTGQQQWATTLQTNVGIAMSEMLSGSPAVTADQVFIGGDGAQVFGVNRANGMQQWKITADNTDSDSERIWSSPTVVDGTLIIGNGSYEVFVADMQGPPCNGYCGTYTFIGNVVGLSTTNGQQVWKAPVADTNNKGVSVWSSAAIDPEAKLAYIGTGQGYGPTTQTTASDKSDSLVAINYESGSFAWWRQYTENDVWSLNGKMVEDWDVGASPNVVDVGGMKLVGVGDKGGSYYMHDRITGDEVWSRSLTPGSHLGGVMSSAAFDGTTIYVASNDGYAGGADNAAPSKAMVYALDALSGDVKWMREVTPGVIGGLTVANGILFFNATAFGSGKLLAWNTDDGTDLWSYTHTGGAAGGVSVSNGRVYVGFGWNWSGTPPAGGVKAFGLP